MCATGGNARAAAAASPTQQRKSSKAHGTLEEWELDLTNVKYVKSLTTSLSPSKLLSCLLLFCSTCSPCKGPKVLLSAFI